MNEASCPIRPKASSLKNELRESLDILRADFESLKHFVNEVRSDGPSATPVMLTKDELDDLLSATLEIQDAANDIEFEAGKIKEILTRLAL